MRKKRSLNLKKAAKAAVVINTLQVLAVIALSAYIFHESGGLNRLEVFGLQIPLPEGARLPELIRRDEQFFFVGDADSGRYLAAVSGSGRDRSPGRWAWRCWRMTPPRARRASASPLPPFSGPM